MRVYPKSISKCVATVIIVVAMVGIPTVGHVAVGPDDFWLITPEEGALPPAQGVPVPGEEGDFTQLSAPLPDEGPIIKIEKPAMDSVNGSPLEIIIHFLPRKSPVDPSSVEVTLVKFFNIDLTDRVLPYLTSDGIHIKEAELPGGEHTVRLWVEDKDGNASAKEMIVKIK